jgi:hypothetical protein
MLKNIKKGRIIREIQIYYILMFFFINDVYGWCVDIAPILFLFFFYIFKCSVYLGIG